MADNLIQVKTVGEIRTASTGNKFRTVLLEDLNNGNSTNYNVYENQDKSIWNSISDGSYEEDLFSGKIIEIDVDDELLSTIAKRANEDINLYNTRKNFKLVYWVFDSRRDLSEKENIEYFLFHQRWKLKSE